MAIAYSIKNIFLPPTQPFFILFWLIISLSVYLVSPIVDDGILSAHSQRLLADQAAVVTFVVFPLCAPGVSAPPAGMIPAFLAGILECVASAAPSDAEPRQPDCRERRLPRRLVRSAAHRPTSRGFPLANNSSPRAETNASSPSIATGDIVCPKTGPAATGGDALVLSVQFLPLAFHSTLLTMHKWS